MRFEPYWRYFIAGKVQSGKSTWTRWLLANIKNYLIYDVKGEYLDLGVQAKNIEEVRAAFASGQTRVVYHTGSASQMEEDFDPMCRFVFDYLRNVTFVIDEVHRYVSKGQISSAFKDIVTVGQGEQYRIGVVAVTQRPQNVHNDVVSCASVRVSFRLDLPRDASMVADYMCCAPEDLRTLPYYNALLYCDRVEPPLRRLDPVNPA